jgi:hypothetical protein
MPTVSFTLSKNNGYVVHIWKERFSADQSPQFGVNDWPRKQAYNPEEFTVYFISILSVVKANEAVF